MNTRTKLLTASAGVLLLAGVGGTLALWSDSADGDELYAATGHLDLVAQNIYAAWDISDLCAPWLTVDGAVGWFDCSDVTETTQISDIDKSSIDTTASPTQVAPVAYNLIQVPLTNEDGSPQLDEDNNQVMGYAIATTECDDLGDACVVTNADYFYMVPGDTIRVVSPFTVDLAGQNIAAKLVLNEDAFDQETGGMKFTLISTSMDEAADAGLISNGKEQFAVTPVGVFQADDLQKAFAGSSAEGTANNEVYFTQNVGGTNAGAYAFFDIHFIDFNNQDDLNLYFPGLTVTGQTVGQNDSNGVTYDSDGVETDLMNSNGQGTTTIVDPTSQTDVTGTDLLNVISGIKALLIQVRPVS